MNETWLPALLLLSESNGMWATYLERLHQQFILDFVQTTPSWPNKRVSLKRHPEYEGKSATFWHMISTGNIEEERTPDFRRCERIAWPRCMIDNFLIEQSNNDRILWWTEKRKGELRYILSLPDFSYAVVIADRGEYVLPWTAFFLERHHQRKKHEKKWREFCVSQKAETAQ